MKDRSQFKTAYADGDFVVFLIGARVNSWWRFASWLPVARAMPKMMRELQEQPDLGLLSCESWQGFRTSIMVQYWRSLEHLMDYAHSRNHEHLPAWRDFNRRVHNSKGVGVWHETYIVPAGNAESLYVNMPPFGLGRATGLANADGRRKSARGRFAAAAPSHVNAA